LANTGEFIICVFVFSFKVSARGVLFLRYVVIILLAFIIT